MRAIGLVPAGSGTLIENLDPLVLNAAARQVLADIAADDLRELVRDFYLDQRFRRDVFARANRRLGGRQRCQALLARTFALARPAAAIRYSAATPTGLHPYNDPTARAIVAALANGPLTLAEVASTSAEDLATNVLVLCAVGDVIPVEAGHAPVETINRAVFRRLDGPEEIRWLTLPCGTALDVDPGLMRALRDREEINEDKFPGWRTFLTAHGL
jgi:hypothetical protein